MRAADWTTQEKVVLPDTDLSSLLQEGELSLELEGSRSQVTELQERVEELQAETEAQDKALRLVHWSGVHHSTITVCLVWCPMDVLSICIHLGR